MKRKVLIPIDQQTDDRFATTTEMTQQDSNPSAADLNAKLSFIPTKEEKENINMSEETLPSIDTSFFTTADNEEASEWTLKMKDVANTTPQETQTVELFSNEAAGVQLATQSPGPTVLTSNEAPAPQPVRKKTRFDQLIKFHDNGRLTRGPIAAGQHLVGEDERLVRLNGEATSYVHHNNMYIHGAALQMGSSASNAQQQEGYDPALGVTGFLPQAIEFLQKGARAATGIAPLDRDGRAHQFGVITILGGADHDKLTNGMLVDPTPGMVEALERIGLAKVKKGYRMTQDLRFVELLVQVSPVLFNNLGYITALEVRFAETEVYGEGKHYIYLHRANDIGGGKSDHSLAEGRTQYQAKALSEEFAWWRAGLELAGGKIGTVESTLGGTARVGRYALLHAKTPRTLFSKDAVETILLDDADYVKNNLGNMIQEYRANFATTMLRTAYGSLSKRLDGVRIDLANRHDLMQRRLRQLTCIESVLRTLFPGVPALDPMFMDLSDERTAIASQENITDAKQFTIHDPVQTNPKGPWQLNRRTRVTAATSYSFGEIGAMALGQRNEEAIEKAREMFGSIRGLATSVEDMLEAGGFTILDIFVPTESLDDADVLITSQMVELVGQVLASAYKQAGSDKVLVHCHKVRGDLMPSNDRVYVRLTEDQPAHNMLLVSTHDAGVREKRTILTDPNLDIIEDRHFAHVYAFARLFQQLIEGHERSNYRFAEEDASLLRAFYRHFYSNSFGSQPNLLLGGSDRPLKK
jgi:hypothetical protein